MHVRGQGIRQPMERERSLVRDDSLLLRPEPGGDQFLVLARGEVHEPVDAPVDAQGLSAADVVHEELRRVPRLSRLLSREQAGLTRRRLVEAVPIEAIWSPVLLST